MLKPGYDVVDFEDKLHIGFDLYLPSRAFIPLSNLDPVQIHCVPSHSLRTTKVNTQSGLPSRLTYSLSSRRARVNLIES